MGPLPSIMTSVMYHKPHNYKKMSLKTQYEQKLTLLSGNVKEVSPDMSEEVGTFGVSILEEAVLVNVLGEERKMDSDRLAELFDEKRKYAVHDPKKFGYGVLHRKKFYDFKTLKLAYMYFLENNLLSSQAWVGITENATGRFLFFNKANKVEKWLQHCVDEYKQSLKDVLTLLDYSQDKMIPEPVVIALGD